MFKNICVNDLPVIDFFFLKKRNMKKLERIKEKTLGLQILNYRKRNKKENVSAVLVPVGAGIMFLLSLTDWLRTGP